MLATEVKNLNQNKIYLVQFALKQIKTSIFLLYLDSASCENLPPKQCCPGLLYASSSSFFSFFLLIFFWGLFSLLFEIYFLFFCIEFVLFVRFFFFFIHFSFLWYIYFLKPLFFLEIPLQLLDKQISATTTNVKCPLFLDKIFTEKFSNVTELDGMVAVGHGCHRPV